MIGECILELRSLIRYSAADNNNNNNNRNNNNNYNSNNKIKPCFRATLSSSTTNHN